MRIINYINQYKYSFVAAIFFCLAIIFENNIQVQLNEYDGFDKTQVVLKKKIEKVDKILDNIENKLDSIDLSDLMLNHDFLPGNLYKNEGIVLLGYSADSLVFWSDNSIPVDNYYVDNQLYSDVANLKNGWFVIRQNHIDDYELFGLILIKNKYSYQNEFIKSDYFHDYGIDINASIVLEKNKGFQIKDNNDNYLFSFVLDSSLAYDNLKIYLSSIFYLLAFILLFFGFRQFIKSRQTDPSKNILLLIFGIVLIVLRYLMLEYHLPGVFNERIKKASDN